LQYDVNGAAKNLTITRNEQSIFVLLYQQQQPAKQWITIYMQCPLYFFGGRTENGWREWNCKKRYCQT